MKIVHEPSDDAILAGWTYFGLWRKSRNALLLLDTITKLELAERLWIIDRGKTAPLRREWQVLRRCVVRGLLRVRASLVEAQSPAETERALYRSGKRATLARRDQMDEHAVMVALIGSPFGVAADTLKRWGLPRTIRTLRNHASRLGLTRRKSAEPTSENVQIESHADARVTRSGDRIRHKARRY